MPVHPHHRAKRLEPEGMGQPAQHLIAAILQHNRLGDDGTQPGHALAQPSRHTTTVQRQVGAARALCHQAIAMPAICWQLALGCNQSTSVLTLCWSCPVYIAGADAERKKKTNKKE